MSELVARIALTRIKGVGSIIARRLLAECGSAKAVFSSREELTGRIKGISKRLVDAVFAPSVMDSAEREAAWVREHNITPFFLGEEGYPSFLSECSDAPVVLFYTGTERLCGRQTLSVVGTRNITAYGRDMTKRFVGELAERVPNLLIVSGLAYGVDVEAHQAALNYGLPTVGVLAHGLDRIYPAVHRETAKRMCQMGGLITEYPSGTTPDRFNFVARNRIIAGLTPATLVIESDRKGGALLTAEMASGYGRDVYAIPGRITDRYSSGCNHLIAKGTAQAVSSAEEIVQFLGWGDKQTQAAEAQTLAFEPSATPPTDPEQCRVWEIITKNEPIHFNDLAARLAMPATLLSAALFELEMDNFIQSLPGSLYSLS